MTSRGIDIHPNGQVTNASEDIKYAPTMIITQCTHKSEIGFDISPDWYCKISAVRGRLEELLPARFPSFLDEPLDFLGTGTGGDE